MSERALRCCARSWLALVLVLVGCDPTGPECGESHPTDRRSTRDLLTCEAAPDVCEGEVVSEIRTADLALAYDLVFVADGFDDSDAFHTRVDALLAGAATDPVGILARAPDLFNVHRVVVPRDQAPARRFGSCREVDELDGTQFLRSQIARVDRAAALAPDVDVVILLSTGVSGRANASFDGHWPLVRMGDGHDASVLTHELGHALFFLGDEYTDVPDPHPLSGHPGRARPNVSLAADEDWDGLVSGAIEGAQRHERGAFRPTDRCRMLDSSGGDPFCPVCSGHIDSWIASRVEGRAIRPTCHAFALPGRTRLICWDPDGLFEFEAEGGGLPPIPLIPCETCPAPHHVEQDFDESFVEVVPSIVVRDTRGETVTVQLD